MTTDGSSAHFEVFPDSETVSKLPQFTALSSLGKKKIDVAYDEIVINGADSSANSSPGVGAGAAPSSFGSFLSRSTLSLGSSHSKQQAGEPIDSEGSSPPQIYESKDMQQSRPNRSRGSILYQLPSAVDSLRKIGRRNGSKDLD